MAVIARARSARGNLVPAVDEDLIVARWSALLKTRTRAARASTADVRALQGLKGNASTRAALLGTPQRGPPAQARVSAGAASAGALRAPACQAATSIQP